MTDFIFLDSQITVYSDCNHVIKRCLLLGWKALTKLDRVLKSRDITLLTKVHIVKASWTARRYNQSILKELSPEYSLEGLMLKLKVQYFGHLMQRTDSFEKHPLMLGKVEGGRRRGRQRWLDGITDSMDMS